MYPERGADEHDGVIGPSDGFGDHAEIDDSGEITIALGHLCPAAGIARLPTVIAMAKAEMRIEFLSSMSMFHFLA
jgi:hypothetical protein